MKGKTVMAIGLLMAVAGVLMIVFGNQISKEGVVIVGGIVFMAVGVVNLVFFSQDKGTGNSMARLLTQVANAAAIVLGACMLIFKVTFEPLVTFVFGAVVAVCALWLFFLLALGTRPHQLPAWLYAFPLLVAGAAVYIFLQHDSETELTLMIGTGVGLTLMGVGGLVMGAYLGAARRAERKRIKAQEETANGPVEPEKPVETPEEPEAEKEEPTEEATATETPKQRPETTEDLDDE